MRGSSKFVRQAEIEKTGQHTKHCLKNGEGREVKEICRGKLVRTTPSIYGNITMKPPRRVCVLI
jgi:hypothetical protein